MATVPAAANSATPARTTNSGRLDIGRNGHDRLLIVRQGRIGNQGRHAHALNGKPAPAATAMRLGRACLHSPPPHISKVIAVNKKSEPLIRAARQPRRSIRRPTFPRRRTRTFGQAQRDPGRRFRALPQDQELPLACQRAALPRLPSAARRTVRADFRLDRRHRRARAQDRRHDAALDRANREAARHRGQRRGLCAAHDMLRELMDDNKTVAAAMRECHELCDKHEDVATASLLENFIDEAERRTLVPVRGEPQGGRFRPLIVGR